MTLYCQQYGTGNHDLVLLHGWGMNADVWQPVISRLASTFRLYLVDLPGYGRSHSLGPLSLAQMSDVIANAIPANATLLGWSLGGLVATQLALDYPQRCQRLITVASSPCFCQQTEWPGIAPQVLENFRQQLMTNPRRTTDRFIALQALGAEGAAETIRQLKQAVAGQPAATVDTLFQGLAMLQEVDLRAQLAKVSQPKLRLYGALDSLVPYSVAAKVQNLEQQSQSLVIEQAAHAPFISHPEQFCQGIEHFIAAHR